MRAIIPPTALALAALALVVGPPGAFAAEVLDQTTGDASDLGQGFYSGWQYMAQSFVPGANMGRILRVELWLERDGSPSDLAFYLRSDGSSDNIATVTIDPAEVADIDDGQWFSIDLPEGTSLSSGSTYWLVLYATGCTAGNDIVWFHAESDYASGSAYISGRDSPAWPPTGNWFALDEGDLAFRTYSDDGWTDADTTTTVSENPDPIDPPTSTSTTVTVTVKDAGNQNVPGGEVTLSVEPKEGTFAGGGSGPVTLDMSSGPAEIAWTPPVFTGAGRTYTFSATYGPYSHVATKKTYKESSHSDTLTVNASSPPSITSVMATLDDRAGDDIGIFVGGLSGWVVVNNTFSASVTEGDYSISKVEFFIDDVLKHTDDDGAPYELTYDMSTLGTNNATLRIKTTDDEGLVSEVTRTILTIAPPPWLFQESTYVYNPQATWDGGSRKYTFTGKIPNHPKLVSDEKCINPDYLPNLCSHFESDIDVVETFTTSGNWTYSINGVLDITVLNAQLLGNTSPATITTRSVSPAYARALDLATWSFPFDLFDETVNVYDGIIASFNVLGIQFDVTLSVDFGFSATVTISGSLGSALTPDNITVAPTLSPYVVIDVALDILWGAATVGSEITPTFYYTLPLVYSFTHDPKLYWDQPCLEFVLRAKFYVDLLWGAGHWESEEYEYGHTCSPEDCGGCGGGGGGGPPWSATAPTPQQQTTRLKLFQAPSLAFDANGNGLALWIHDNDPSEEREDPEIFYAVFQAGAWGAPQRLTNNQSWETDPKVAFVGNNQAVAVWTQNTLTEAQGEAATTIKEVLEAQDLWYSEWNISAAGWSQPLALTNDPGPVKASDGRVALAGDQTNGRAIATWVRDADGDPSTTTDWDIYYALYETAPPGPGWTVPPGQVTMPNALLEAEPDFALAPNGNATCAWVQDSDGDPYTNADRQVMYAQWNPMPWPGAWGMAAQLPPPLLPIPPQQGCLWPSVTHDTASNPVIAFTSRGQDPSGGDTGEGFKDELWWARWQWLGAELGWGWNVEPASETAGGPIAARWPVAKRRPDNFVQVVYRSDDEIGLDGFDGDLGTMVIDVRTTYTDDYPGRVPSSDDVLDWQIDMDVDANGDVQILWVREGSSYPGAPFGDGYDDLMLMVLPTGMPNLAVAEGNVTLSEVYPVPPANVTVSAKVENLNTKEVATPFQVEFYLDSVAPENLLGSQTVTYLGPNSDTIVSLTFEAPPGSHPVLAVADATNVIPETNETDNTGATTLWYQAPPTHLEAYPDPSSAGIALTWQPSVMPTVLGYNVYRSITSGSGYASIGSTTPGELDFLDTDVQPDTDYYYVVTAIDPWGGESALSNEATANVGPDTDGDGAPDINDQDDDDDGMPDAWEATYEFDTLDPSDASQDADGDGLTNLEEYEDGTDPRDPDSHRDITPPDPPAVVDDGDYSGDPSSLHATWSASDPETGIIEYQYAVGTSAGSDDVMGWTSAGLDAEATASELSLTDGQAYYISVKACNGAGLWSDPGSSDGIVVDASRATAPIVNDGVGADIDCHGDDTTLSANWSATDPHSGISGYWYAVGTSPRGQEVAPWTDARTDTSMTLTSLSLADGATYYVSVRAENGGGLSSIISVSDGVLIDATDPEVSITQPSEGAVVYGTIDIIAEVVEANVTQVEAWVDSDSLGVGPAAPYQWSFDADALTPGAHTISVVATDCGGNSGSASIGVTAPENEPIACFTSAKADPDPYNYAYEFDASCSFHGHPAHQIVWYEMDFEGDGSYDAAQATPSFAFTYPAAGTYTPTLRVTDDNEPPLSNIVSHTLTAGPQRICSETLAGDCWHMITIPCDPLDRDPTAVFRDPNGNPIPISGNLHRYGRMPRDPSDGYVTYYDFNPGWFGEIVRGDGYWLWLFEDVKICYDAVCDPGPAPVHFAKAGWYMVGSPRYAATPAADILWSHAGEGPEPWDSVKNLWFQDPAIPYICPTGYTSLGVLPTDETHVWGVHDGAWGYMFVDEVTMEVPAP